MATEIRVPTLGESVTEATIGRWFKKTGESIATDEAVVELETDKVTLEVPAPAAGMLQEIAANEGETVTVGALLGLIAEGVEGSVSAPAPTAAEEKPETSDASTEADGEDANASPAAARMMEEEGIDASSIEGSGKRGQILKSDVIEAIEKGTAAKLGKSASASTTAKSEPAPSPTPPSPPVPAAARAPSPADDETREERVRMTRLRQTVAQRLKDAQQTAAMLTTFNEVDMSAVMDLRKKYKDLFEKKHGVKLGFMGFFSKAVCHALAEIPAVNAEIDGTDIIYKKFCHIGVAVGTAKGLVVPVVRDADQMTIAEIEKEIGRLGIAARDGKLSVADMQGGTFTISNGGVYGSLMSTPILNAPQSGILGMHKIQERPVAVGGQVVIRPMMYLALSYDHRIVDGKEAVTFLVRVKESLEDPERLVLDL